MNKYFDYLDALWESGVTNMYGAAPYLQQEFPELSFNHAQAVYILFRKHADTPDGLWRLISVHQVRVSNGRQNRFLYRAGFLRRPERRAQLRAANPAICRSSAPSSCPPPP